MPGHQHTTPLMLTAGEVTRLTRVPFTERSFSELTEALDGDHGPRVATDHVLRGGGAPEAPDDGIQPAVPYPRDHCRGGTP